METYQDRALARDQKDYEDSGKYDAHVEVWLERAHDARSRGEDITQHLCALAMALFALDA